jgi:hypothetical protein
MRSPYESVAGDAADRRGDAVQSELALAHT